MPNHTFAAGPFSLSFRFFGVLPRNGGVPVLDTLHLGLHLFKRGEGEGANVMFRNKSSWHLEHKCHIRVKP